MILKCPGKAKFDSNLTCKSYDSTNGSCNYIYKKCWCNPRHLWSASQITTYHQCKRKWLLSYIFGLQVPDTSAIELGTEFGKQFSNFVLSQPLDYIPTKTEGLRLLGFLKGLQDKKFQCLVMPDKNTEIEKKLIQHYDNFGLLGYIDIYNSQPDCLGLKVRELKYSKRPEFYNVLTLCNQIGIYLLLTNATKLLLQVFTPPAIRQGKMESDSDFINRVRNETIFNGLSVCTQTFFYDSQFNQQELLSELSYLTKELHNRFQNNVNYSFPREITCTQYGEMCEFVDVCKVYVDWNIEIENLTIKWNKRDKK
jgi:hypothetical protein